MMSERALRLLGLGARGGTLVLGVGGVRAALKRGELALVVIAGDHSPRTEEKVGRLARAVGVTVLRGPDAQALGYRLGRPAVQAVGVRDERLATGLVGCERQA